MNAKYCSMHINQTEKPTENREHSHDANVLVSCIRITELTGVGQLDKDFLTNQKAPQLLDGEEVLILDCSVQQTEIR